MISAQNFFKTNENKVCLEISAEEKKFIECVRDVWRAILRFDIDNDTDFFSSGAGSMDVVRLVEEIKELANIELQNEDIYMNTTFEEFYTVAILKARGAVGKKEVSYEGVELEANKMKIKFPTQLFINGEFVNSDSGKTLTLINPTDESVICKVQSASKTDVDRAVKAAKKAFEEGEWSKISARERGQLLFKYVYLNVNFSQAYINFDNYLLVQLFHCSLVRLKYYIARTYKNHKLMLSAPSYLLGYLVSYIRATSS